MIPVAIVVARTQPAAINVAVSHCCQPCRELVQAPVQIHAFAGAAALAEACDGVNCGAERGPNCGLGHREAVGEPQQRQVRRPLAPAREAHKGEDQAETLRRRRRRSTASPGQGPHRGRYPAAARHAATRQRLRGDHEAVTRRVMGC